MKRKKDEAEATKRRLTNLVILERLMEAARVCSSDGWCGYEYDGEWYRCFRGHERFEHSEQWSTHYGGPDFCADLNWCQRAEEVIRQKGLIPEYMAGVLTGIRPRWDRLKNEEQVLECWFALVHRSAAERARALAEAVSAPEEERSTGGVEEG